MLALGSWSQGSSPQGQGTGRTLVKVAVQALVFRWEQTAKPMYMLAAMGRVLVAIEVQSVPSVE